MATASPKPDPRASSASHAFFPTFFDWDRNSVGQSNVSRSRYSSSQVLRFDAGHRQVLSWTTPPKLLRLRLGFIHFEVFSSQQTQTTHETTCEVETWHVWADRKCWAEFVYMNKFIRSFDRLHRLSHNTNPIGIFLNPKTQALKIRRVTLAVQGFWKRVLSYLKDEITCRAKQGYQGCERATTGCPSTKGGRPRQVQGRRWPTRRGRKGLGGSWDPWVSALLSTQFPHMYTFFHLSLEVIDMEKHSAPLHRFFAICTIFLYFCCVHKLA